MRLKKIATDRDAEVIEARRAEAEAAAALAAPLVEEVVTPSEADMVFAGGHSDSDE